MTSPTAETISWTQMIRRAVLSPERLGFVSWIVFPLLLAWVMLGYLVGILHDTGWENSRADSPASMVPSETNVQIQDQIAAPITWQGQGLVTLWFDDAWVSQYTNVINVTEQHDMPAALAVPTRLVGEDAYMNWAQIKRLQFLGWEITAHSRTHTCDANRHDDAFLDYEVKGSHEDLLTQGIFTDHFVTPCGAVTPALNDKVKQHFLSNRTVVDGLNPLPLADRYAIRVKQVDPGTTVALVQNWLNEAKRNGQWLIFMFHQVDESGAEYSTTPAMFRDIVQTIAESGIQVVVPSQAINITSRAN